jgi:L-aspartate oxidase
MREEGAAGARRGSKARRRAGCNTRAPLVAWEHCGIIRHAEGLRRAISELEGDETNVGTVARLIARCALAREESRGAHFRTDFPEKRAEFQKHSAVARDGAVAFR